MTTYSFFNLNKHLPQHDNPLNSYSIDYSYTRLKLSKVKWKNAVTAFLFNI